MLYCTALVCKLWLSFFSASRLEIFFPNGFSLQYLKSLSTVLKASVERQRLTESWLGPFQTKI